ncbi:MAG: N-6 DNA methylase [Deltaproteobacteria bacterium]|nr:N-6 DNA methylase [Deltaproteobacteria bacterium]
MTFEKNIEKLIHDSSTALSQEMKNIVGWAKSEEDVRHECNKLIDDFLKKAEIKVKGRHEYGLAGGRIDSKYGGVIIEYKDSKGVGKIGADPNSPGAKAIVQQIKQRFIDFKKEEKIASERLFGVGCDGNNLIFVRYRSNKFEVENPHPATPHTVERLLRALVSLGAKGKSFTPDHLVGDFGAESNLAEKYIRVIYQVITQTKSKKTLTFFDQWKILFGEVCGYDVEGSNEKINTLAGHYGISEAKPAELLFSVHSYYALFMKFLAAEIASSFSPLGVSIIKKCAGAPTSEKLKHEMEFIEQGGIWSQLGITNFLEGDIFSWYLDAWDEHLAELVKNLLNTLDQYDPTTLSVEPAESRDLLKKLYQELFPKKVRHDLGEYYTPDWLAEHVLNEIGYDGDPDKRLLDPACGSGTFLVMTINRIKAWFEEHRHACGFGEAELVDKILKNIIGFDLNPLAVMAARTNYLMAIRDLLKFASGVEIPVYLCDSVLTPMAYGDLFIGAHGKAMKIKTSAGDFNIPVDIATSRTLINKYADTMEFCVRHRYGGEEFIQRCQGENLPIDGRQLHLELYDKLQLLNNNNQNGIWARIIKNAFAPLFVGKVDYIAGNPPWVSYENLPSSYREDTAAIWDKYKLFPKGGWRARFAKGNTDLAMIFTYAAMDNFLKETGKLGFVINQSVFQSKDAGVGFRRFQISWFKRIEIHRVDDLTVVQPFEGATNRTATIIASLSKRATQYPVPYIVWKKQSRITPLSDQPLDQVKLITSRFQRNAYPVASLESPWIILPAKVEKATVDKVQNGKQSYRAWKGCDTRGGNGIFWLEVLKSKPNLIFARNTTEFSKDKTIPEKQWGFESGLIYPLLRGRDTERWKCSPQFAIVFPHQGDAAIEEQTLKRKYPKTYAYFHEMREYLSRRKMYDLSRKELDFYALFETGDFLLSPYKVVFKEIAQGLTSAVLGSHSLNYVKNNVVIPDHKLMLVPFEKKDAAHYLCAVLNSAIARFIVKTYTLSTQISTHILEYLKMPQFDEQNKLHMDLSNLSEQCHEAALKNKTETIAALEMKIDKVGAGLWGIDDKELERIQEALKEMEISSVSG